MAGMMAEKEKMNLKSIYEREARCKAKYIKGIMQNYIAEILLKIDDHHISEAEDWFRKAIETHEGNDMRWHLARIYTGYADLFKRKGDQSKARENLGRAIEIFKKCGADGWIEKTERELAALS
jgi:hypothetical protein